MTPLQEILEDAVGHAMANRLMDAPDRNVIDQALTAIAGVVEECMPPEHVNTNVPSENLNAQEDGEAMGWNECRDEIRNNLRAKGLLNG